MTLASIRQLIADDAHACTFQSFGQYRTALLKAIDEASPTPPSLPIDFKQASELLEMFGGEAGMVSLQIGDGHNGRGLYAHASSYPEEGAVFLGVADEEAAPTQASEQGGWQWVPKTPTPAMLDAVMVDEVGHPEWLGLLREQYAEDYCVMLAAAPKHSSPHPEEGALLLGGDEGGKKGGAS